MSLYVLKSNLIFTPSICLTISCAYILKVTSNSSPQHIGEPPYAQPMKPAKPPKPQFNPAGSSPMVPQPDITSNQSSIQNHSMPQSQIEAQLEAQMMSGGGMGGGTQSQSPRASPAAPHNNNLENMLGDLSSDMSRQGITTMPKGHCAKCAKPIIGQVSTL